MNRAIISNLDQFVQFCEDSPVSSSQSAIQLKFARLPGGSSWPASGNSDQSASTCAGVLRTARAVAGLLKYQLCGKTGAVR